MIYPVYAIRDEKVGFGTPRIFLNEEVAKRQFGFEVNQEGSPMAYAPSDYSLYMIGKYNTDSASFDSNLPEYVVNGKDVFRT